MRAIDSLRVRLPLLTAALVLAVVTTFLWMAYRELDGTLARAGGQRASTAADQVANLLARAVRQGENSLDRISANADVRALLLNPTDETRERARRRLTELIPTGPRRIEVWDDSGSQLLDIVVPPPADGLQTTLSAAGRPSKAGSGQLQVAGNVVFSDTVAEIAADSLSARPGSPAPRRLGFLLVRSTLSINPPGILAQLVGADAVVQIGNTTGGLWTDLSNIVPAPSVDVSRSGIAEYQAAGGDSRLGAVSTVRGAPWAVWVEFPRSTIVAPARAFLGRMSLVALICVAIGALVAGNVSARMTRPLSELADAAGEIAAGDYSRGVAVATDDEIGRLGRAFNAMATDIRAASQELEARVLERSQALDALRESEAHYRAIVEVAFDCIIKIDAAGKVLEFNRAAEQTFGYLKSDVLGRELADLIIPPAYREAHRKGLARYLATGKSLLIGQLMEMSAMRSDGTEVPVELAISAVVSDGSPTFIGVARNVAERKRTEATKLQAAAVEEQNRRMLEANRLKGEFVANMSHELRTPLNAIIGFAELMFQGKVGPVSAAHEEYLGDILTSSRHLLQLINDVLDLAKVESGKMELRPEPVDLEKLVREVSDILRGLAAQKHLRIAVQIQSGFAVVVDPSRVKQILYNYLSNAIKFTPDGGEVRVRITPSGADAFRIDVEDTGVGIRPEDVNKLFVEFHQLDAGSAKKYQGTGLGLALTKRLAEAQGGRVAVQSTLGVGSTFSVILPRVVAATAEEDWSTRTAEDPELQPGTPTVLILDDDPGALKLAEATLREAGYRPLCAVTAAAALDMAAADPPAMVVVDLMMPGTDGFEFVARLRETPCGRTVPVIAWTVKDLDVEDRRRLRALEMDVVLKRLGGSAGLADEVRRLLPLSSPAGKSPVRG